MLSSCALEISPIGVVWVSFFHESLTNVLGSVDLNPPPVVRDEGGHICILEPAQIDGQHPWKGMSSPLWRANLGVIGPWEWAKATCQGHLPLQGGFPALGLCVNECLCVSGCLCYCIWCMFVNVSMYVCMYVYYMYVCMCKYVCTSVLVCVCMYVCHYMKSGKACVFMCL